MAVRHLLRLALAAACVLGHPWLPGADARIGDGAAIGRAAVIGAGAILPPGAVIADGVPLPPRPTDDSTRATASIRINRAPAALK